MRVAVLYSGGKDSTYTVWLLQHQAWDVTLLTVCPTEPDSMLFHYPAVSWTKLQADAMGLEHTTLNVEAGVSEGLASLERMLSELKRAYGIEGLATGAVASDYQKSRFDRTCENAGLNSYSPLWHKKPGTIVNDLVDSGFRIMITAVAARGLDRSWLGQTLDRDAWRRLEQVSARDRIHLTGEGGEYESFVTDGPNFTKSIRVGKTQSVWDGQSGRLTIEDASLADKFRD